MLAELDGVEISLLGFIAAFGFSYFGMRQLWAAVGSRGFIRGLLLGAPITALAIVFAASGQPGTGIAMAMAAAVLMLTLGTGVAAAGRADYDYTTERTTPPTLRLVAPLAACACAIGFHGNITLFHWSALTIIGGLTLWSAAPHAESMGRWRWKKIAVATVLMATAIVLTVFSAAHFQAAAGAMVVTPLVVLLAAPALLLSLMGLLSAESREGHFASAGDTIAGFVITCLGLAMPAAIAIGFLRNLVAVQLPAKLAHHSVVMPVATWRIDSLLLLITAVMLSPAAMGKMRLGRLEGGFLIAVYLAYAAIASRSGLLAQ